MPDPRRGHLRVLSPADQAHVDAGDTEPLPSLWYVRVTFGGRAVADRPLAKALRRLTEANPVGMTVRYAPDRAEVSYWDEAHDAEDAAAMALRVWHEHRTELGLPDWQVVALEVFDRDIWHGRYGAGHGLAPGSPVTRLQP